MSEATKVTLGIVGITIAAAVIGVAYLAAS